MPKAICPECGTMVNVGGNPYVGQQVTCPECDALLEVVSLNPLELDWAYEDVDDYEYDEEEFGDEEEETY